MLANEVIQRVDQSNQLDVVMTTKVMNARKNFLDVKLQHQVIESCRNRKPMDLPSS